MRHILISKTFPESDVIKIVQEMGAVIEYSFQGLSPHYIIDVPNEQVLSCLIEKGFIVEPAFSPFDLKILRSSTSILSHANWGLTRIDQREWNPRNLRKSITEGFNSQRTGRGVDIYVVDTGIRPSHEEFTGRVTLLHDSFAPQGSPQFCLDADGHGTHVASSAAGSRLGVAKEAQILVSKALDNGRGTLQTVIQAIDACVKHHRDKVANGIQRPSVMNLSLGGGAHPAQIHAVEAAINAGIVVVAAAGNDGRNLAEEGYDVMPAEIDRAITVGSTNVRDVISPFSNYGAIIDVFGPGQDVLGASHESDNGLAVLSGTSMASPHVSGVIALYLQDGPIFETRQDVQRIHDLIVRTATVDMIDLGKAKAVGTPNRLVFFG